MPRPEHRLNQTVLPVFFVLVGFLLAACGESGTPEESPAAASTEAVSAEEDSDDEPADVTEVDDPWLRIQHVSEWKGDLDGMIERGFVRLLVVHSKTFYFLDGARERGISAEERLAFENYLNQKLQARKKSVDVVPIPVRRDQMIPFLVKGYGDIGVGNWTVTEERQKLVDFTNQGLADVRELLVTGPAGPQLAALDDLSGQEVWVRRSSSYYESLRELNARFRQAGKPEVVIRKADEYLEDEDLLEMVNAGLLPATVIDSHKWEWLWSKIFKSLKVNPEVAIRERGEVAPMLRKDSPQLKAALDEFYKTRGVGTGFFNTVVNRYARKTNWVLNANASSERKKYLAVVDYFKKYGQQYDFDDLMLAAQGYQESRLDQGARSHVGAIGIMQLMPATAAGSPVFIPNVDEAEPNVHAGVKYLRYIVDKYFDDPEIDDVNKLLFAFASYNAGPNRVARLRGQATEYGFDPNEWFNNVERVVERKVGQEPIRYVGNIYKYYVAYRRLRDLERERQQGSQAPDRQDRAGNKT